MSFIKYIPTEHSLSATQHPSNDSDINGRLSDTELEHKLVTSVNQKSTTTTSTTSINESNSITLDTSTSTTSTIEVNQNGNQPPAYTPSNRTTTTRTRRNRLSDMRFGSVRPVLTPLGQRLITLSDRKLYALEPPTGGRDKATLLKAILIQESVNSAWRSVERGQQVQVTDWSTTDAIGLDVIGEEEEEMDEAGQARWFEELVQSLEDDELSDEHEWAESEVGSAADEDDFEAYEEYEHYTLPSPPSSPNQLPSSPTSPSSELSVLDAPTPLNSSIEVDPTISTAHVDVAVDVIEVDDHQAVFVASDRVWRDSTPSAPLLSASRSPSTSMIPTISLVDDDLDSDFLVLPLAIDSFTPALTSVSIGPAYPDARPSTPLLSATCSPVPIIPIADDELDCDDLVLPPALHRCSSTSSLPCDCEDIESDDCYTPPSSCEELDTSIGSLLSLHLDDPGEEDVDRPPGVYPIGSEKRSLRVEQGLGLDLGDIS